MNSYSKNSAFTLIELLVVISIILIASSIIFIGGGGGEGAKLSSSQRIISGIAQGARGQAILKNAKVRLIIYSEANVGMDPEKLLRYFGIIYADPKDTDQENPTSWIAATQGTYLPEGIYFNKILSQGWPGSTMNLNYPRLSAQSGGSEQYYYYEFNSNGTMATGYDNTWLAIQAGTLKPNSGGVLGVEESFNDIENEGLKAALIFRRVGTTTLVSDPADIQ
jgi:prepilin-type N-terminal cleavage/methylation domain-containing protein